MLPPVPLKPIPFERRSPDPRENTRTKKTSKSLLCINVIVAQQMNVVKVYG